MQIMEEEGRFEAEVAEVGAWWNTERFRLTKRPYAARDVVLLRGTLRQSYASGEMAKKLWRTLKAHQAAGTASRTFGALDPVQARSAIQYLMIRSTCTVRLAEFVRAGDDDGQTSGHHLRVRVAVLVDAHLHERAGAGPRGLPLRHRA